MKKIAILLRGHKRTYRKCFPSILKTFNEYDCEYDIFFHIWEERDDKKDINIILNRLKPKAYVIEKQNEEIIKKIKKINQTQLMNKHMFYYQIYSVNVVTNLMLKYAIKNHIKYDVVVLLRFDFILYKDQFIKQLQNLENKQTFIVTDRKFPYYDLFQIMDYNTSLEFSDIIKINYYLFRKALRKKFGYGYNPLIEHFINNKNIPHTKIRLGWLKR